MKTKSMKITTIILSAVLILMTMAVFMCLTPLKADAATEEKVYIKEVVIHHEGTKSEAKEALKNGGYTIVDYNLDEGATYAGNYVGYKTTTDPSEAITGFIFRLGANGPDKYTYRNCEFKVIKNVESSSQKQDVNEGIGESFLYGYYTKDPGWGAPITEIVVNGESSLSGYTTAIFGRPDGKYFDGEPAHLNQNLNGNSKYPAVYLHYKPCDHAGATKSYTNNGDDHSYTWSCCQTTVTEDHSYVNGYCSLCETYQPAKGDGTEGSPYLISNAGQLYWFSQQVNGGNKTAHAKLTANIDLGGSEWISIASTALYYNTTTYADKGYQGTFDGNGKVISNLKITGSGEGDYSMGLFGTLSGTVKNLGIENYTYVGAGKDSRVGAVVGQILGGTVENCYAVGVNINTLVNTTNGVAGGIAGCNYAGTVKNSYTYDVTIAAGRSAGIVGDNRGDISDADRLGTIQNCYTNFGSLQSGNAGIVNDSRYNLPAAMFTNGSLTWYLNGQKNGIWKQGETYPAYTGTAVTQSLLSTYTQPSLVDGIYQITSESELRWFAEYANWTDASVNAVLVNDIEMVGDNWIPIGYSGNKYTGTFDGQGKSITGFSMTITKGGVHGLFGDIANATIKNFSISGTVETLMTTEEVFYYGVVGVSDSSTISDIHSSVNLTVKDGYFKNGVAGIVGTISNTTIDRCSFSGTLDLGTADVDCAGGIVGYGNYNQTHIMTNCAFYGTIHSDNTATEDQVGGIIGYYRGQNIQIKNCLSIGTIDLGNSTYAGMIGGRVLQIYEANLGNLSNNYYSGTLSAFAENDTGDYAASEPSDYEGYGDGNAKLVNADQLASGEIAVALGVVWGQTLDTDEYPVIGGDTVYQVTNCKEEIIYSNTNQNLDHIYDNGFCQICDAYEPCLGSGTQADPYQISNAGQLYWIRANHNETTTMIYAVLTKDIVINQDLLDDNGDLNEGSFRTWSPMTISIDLDGQFHSISGLYCTDSNAGFLYYSSKAYTAHIRNMGIEDSYFRGSGRVGSFFGASWNNTISLINCYSSATVISTGTGFWSGAGGLAGYIQSGQAVTISNCLFTGKVSGDPAYTAGILAGYGGDVTNCYYVSANGLTGMMNKTDIVGKTEGFTKDEFKSGVVAYLIQNNLSEHIWGQDLTQNDAVPSFKASKVYPVYEQCKIIGYSNTEPEGGPVHNYLQNGICEVCGAYEPAILITESNYETYGLSEAHIGYYAIENYGQLYSFVIASNALTSVDDAMNGVLIADITVNEQIIENGELVADVSALIPWTPLNDFRGIFDGNGHFISGLYAAINQNVGFAATGSGTIENLFVKDTYFSTSDGYAGGIVAHLKGGSVIACGFDGYVTSADSDVGGIVGYTYVNATTEAVIKNCYNLGTVVGCGETYYGAGGIVGYFYMGTLQYCYNMGQVSNANNGAIAGRMHQGTVRDNYYLSGDGIQGIGNEDEINLCTQAMTKEDMESGKLAILLNQVSDITWGQDLSKDTYPTPYAKPVYGVYNGCIVNQYTNDEAYANAKPQHSYVNGICSVCLDIEPAVLITADNLKDFAELDETFIGYYAIANYGQLVWFRDNLIHSLTPNAQGVLVADITINENVLTSDGKLNEEGVDNFISWTSITGFMGVFDGKNHTISGIYVDSTANAVGLFGEAGLTGIKPGPTIQNLKITDSYIKGSGQVGALAGKVTGRVDNISVNAVVIGTENEVGGIVGLYTPNGETTNLEMRGSVTGLEYTGGIFGIVYGGSDISHATNYADVEGTNRVGGIAGVLSTNATYVGNEGSIKGSNYVGGIAGDHSDRINYAYNTGAISGTSYVGGIIGTGHLVFNSLNAGSISGTSHTQPISGDLGQYQSAENNYYVGTSELDSHDGTTFLPAEQFTSGALAWFLNGGIDGKYDGTQIWYQTLGTDICPKFTGGTVYYGYENLICTNTERIYKNSPLYINQEHNYDESGFCACGRAEPGELITEENLSAYRLTEEYIGYYAIQNVGNLYWFARMSNGSLTTDFIPQDNTLKVVLVKDIKVNEAVLNADGTVISDTSALRSWEIIQEFKGVLDGNGHSLSGLYNASGSTALVKQLASDGVIRNLTVKDSAFTVATFVKSNYGSIVNCHSFATLLISIPDVWSTDVGGICAQGYESSFISECTFSGRFIGTSENDNISSVGGIIGYNKGTVSQSANFASIDTSSINKHSTVGGIAGDLYVSGRIENCYNIGDLTNDSKVGGIVGFITLEGGAAVIESCYNYGSVKARYLVGAILGGYYNNGGTMTITNCYYLDNCAVDTNGDDFNQPDVARYVNGIGASQYDSSPADIVGCTESVPATDFEIGKVAYLLNGSKNAGIWKQTLDTDTYPNFTGESVYCGYVSCAADAPLVYSNNSDVSATKPAHNMGEATCVKPSTCLNNCGYTEGEVDPTNHDMTEATCTVEGVCKNGCGKTTEKSAHDYDNGFCIVCDGYQPAEGSGIETDPYLISNAGQLYWFAAVINEGYGDTARNLLAHAKLVKNITVNENVLDANGDPNNGTFRQWTPIGYWNLEMLNGSDAMTLLLANAFNGTFDGNGYTIYGIYKNGDISNVPSEDNCFISFFTSLNTEAMIKNLTISDSYFSGMTLVSSIVAMNMGTVTNCMNNATIVSMNEAAGLVFLNAGAITNCANRGKIVGNSVCGIVYDHANPGIIQNCYNSGNLIATQNSYAITSRNSDTIINCYYLADSETDQIEGTTAKTFAEFKSGEVAWLLQNGQTADGEGNIPHVWGQTIGTEDYPVFNGAVVYIVLACDEKSIADYSNTAGLIKDHSPDEDDGDCTTAIECSICGEDLVKGYASHIPGEDDGDCTTAVKCINCEKNAVEGKEHTYNEYGYCKVCQVDFLGATVTIGLDLSMNYYVFLADAFKDAEVTFVIEETGKTATVKGTLFDAEKKIYIFTFNQLPPQTMGDTITATLKLGDDVLVTKDYSIKAYAEYLLNHETDEKLLQLVSDMLHYGAAAQTYTGYNTDALVNAVAGIKTASTATPAKSDKSLIVPEGVTVEGVMFASVGVWFDYNNKIYVKLSTSENAKLVVNGKEVTLDGDTYMTEAINATGFNIVYTFELYEVTDEGETLVQTLTYSVNSYVYAMKDKTDGEGNLTAMAKLAIALYNYGASAEAYKDAA